MTFKAFRVSQFALAAVAGMGCLFVNDNGATKQSSLITQADARVGRPLTPGSVAGVARRTDRRAVRRGAIAAGAAVGAAGYYGTRGYYGAYDDSYGAYATSYGAPSFYGAPGFYSPPGFYSEPGFYPTRGFCGARGYCYGSSSDFSGYYGAYGSPYGPYPR